MTSQGATNEATQAPAMAVTGRRQLARLKRDSVRRVVDMLDAEADAAPTDEFRALWRRLAANTRREMLVSPD